MWPAKLRTALALVSSAALVAACIVIYRQSTHIAALERRHSDDVRAIQKLNDALRRPGSPDTGAATPSAGASSSERASSRANDQFEIASRDAAIEQLKQQLEQARADIARLNSDLQTANQDKQNAVTAEDQRVQKAQQDWSARMDDLRQQLDTAQAEAQAARERAASVASANAKLKSDYDGVSARAAEFRRSIASLQDIDHRRDASLNSIIRRYRDVTEQFREMTGDLSSKRGADSGGFDGLALSRIQNAISLADDDLRRLNELNAQAHQIENKLARN